MVYGNRAYEDALLELNNIVGERGFRVAASAALVAQHSMAPEVGKGRPDEQDSMSILEFAGKVLDKIKNGFEDQVKVPGNYPYNDGMSMPVTLISLDSCNKCGKCASACPKKARILLPPLQEQMEQKLGALKSVHRENEYFL